MTRFQFLSALVIALVLTIAAGTIQGRLTNRWGASSIAQQASETLEALPREIGIWRMVDENELSSEELGQLQPYGYVNRTYVNLETNERVSFFILVGPVGRTVVHTPEVCFSSRDYERTEEKQPEMFQLQGRRPDELWSMTFESTSLDGGLLRVYYGWTDGGQWEAPEGGRWKYAGLPYLYKLQLATYLPGSTNLEQGDVGREFLEQLIPVLEKHTIPAKRRGLAGLLAGGS